MLKMSLTWLQPPASEKWFGYFLKDKKAEVWFEPACGRGGAHWKWCVLEHNLHGEIAGMGEREVDIFTAQMMAADMFFHWESKQV